MKILVAGDFYPSARVKPLIENGKFEEVLGGVRPVIESVDYSIVNYEAPVVLGDYKPLVKCGPNLSSTPKGVETIKWAGFKMATLANNHTYDFGAEGLRDTMMTCHKYGIDTVGAGRNLKEAQQPFYKYIDGKTLAVINCCEHEFSIAEDDKPGANPLNPVEQYYQIQEARRNANHVLVIVHGGHEHFQLPSLRMQETYRFFIDAGADSVVNHHQHCYSGYEVYKGKPIFYGLGNFCFDSKSLRNTTWNEGYMVMLDFSKDDVGYELIPYTQCNEIPSVQLMTETEKGQFNKRINELNGIISNEKLLAQKLREYYEKGIRGELTVFEPYSNGILLRLYYHGLLPSCLSKLKLEFLVNHTDCESHRDKMIYALKHKLETK